MPFTDPTQTNLNRTMKTVPALPVEDSHALFRLAYVLADTTPEQTAIDTLIHGIATSIGAKAQVMTAADLAGEADLLTARAACIEDALQDPFIDKETTCELLDELAGIYNELGKE